MGSSQHTTPLSPAVAASVTITHPHHPLRGQRVTLVRVRQGAEPDLIVRLPDGTHAALAMSSTDYAGTPAVVPPGDVPPRLALAGLRQAVRLIERFQQRAGGPAGSATSRLPDGTHSPYDQGR